MASKKGFKHPVKKQNLSSKPIQIDKGHSKSPKLTTSKYEETVDAVANFKFNRSPTQAKSIKIKALEPKENASLENSQPSQTDSTVQSKINSDRNHSTKLTSKVLVETKSSSVKITNTTVDSESESTTYTEHMKNSSSLSETKRSEFKKPRSLREALNVMENNSQFSNTLSQFGSSSSLTLQQNTMSQPPKHLSHRERLQWLQDHRGVGLWIQCDYCKKWRWSDIADPVDVPKNWTCEINPDTNYNQCSIPEKPISMYVEEDLIHNAYTAGSIVWAKMYGYPWWPAMVDDCPDTEQYYWLDGYSDIPTCYHVVFFDYEQNEVTRSWVPVHCILSYKHQPNLNKKFTVNISFEHRIACAKQQAASALELSVKQRLAQYSFLARWKNDIVTPPPSDIELDDEVASGEVTKPAKHKDNKSKGHEEETQVESDNERDLIEKDKGEMKKSKHEVMKANRKHEESATDKEQKQTQNNNGFDENETSKEAKANFKKINLEAKKAKRAEKRWNSDNTQLKSDHSSANKKHEEELENIKSKEKKCTDKKSKTNEQNSDDDKDFDKKSSRTEKNHDKSKNEISKHSKTELTKEKSEFAKVNQAQSNIKKMADAIVELDKNDTDSTVNRPYPKSSSGKNISQPTEEHIFNKLQNQLREITVQVSSVASTNRGSVKTQNAVSNTGKRDDNVSEKPIIIDDSSDDEKEKRVYDEDTSSMEAFAIYTQFLFEDDEARSNSLQTHVHSKNDMDVIDGTKELDTNTYKNKSKEDVSIENVEEKNITVIDDSDDETQIDKGEKIKKKDKETSAKKVNKRKMELKSVIRDWNSNAHEAKEKKKKLCKKINKVNTDDKNVNKTDSEEDGDKDSAGKVSKAKKPKLSMSKDKKSKKLNKDEQRVNRAKNTKNTEMTVTNGKQQSTKPVEKPKFMAKRRLSDSDSNNANIDNKLAKASMSNDLEKLKKPKKSCKPSMHKTPTNSESKPVKSPSHNNDVTDSKEYKRTDSFTLEKFSMHSSFCNLANQDGEYTENFNDIYNNFGKIKYSESTYSSAAAVIPNSEDR